MERLEPAAGAEPADFGASRPTEFTTEPPRRSGYLTENSTGGSSTACFRP